MAVRGKLDFGGELPGQPLLTARNDGAEQVLEGPAAGQEQGGRSLISSDPLPPGTVYTAGIRTDGTVGLSGGAGKLKMAGGAAGTIKESIQRASYVYAKKNDLGLARDLDTSDFHVQVLDLVNNHVQAEVGVAFFIACYSAIRKAPVSAAMLILGDMSVQGNIKALPSLVEPLQLAMDNGAKRALIPLGNKHNFFEVSADILEHVDPVFFGDPGEIQSRPGKGSAPQAAKPLRHGDRAPAALSRVLLGFVI